ncbi:hypothetical protein Tco_0496796 [Tanacetum coccineum]
MVKTMEEYMSKTQANYGSGIVRPKIDDNDHFELKGQFLKELCNNTFSGSDHEDVKEHIKIYLIFWLEEEKAYRHGKVYNWETATYGRIWYDDDVHDLKSVETEFPAIIFNDKLTSEVALSCETTVSSLDDNKIDFRISFDESDVEDYTVIFDKNSFSYKILFVDDLKTDSENDNGKLNIPLFPSSEHTVSYFDDFDYFKDFEKEFPAIAYNDALTSKLDFSEPTVSPQHIDEFDETSLSECDDDGQNVIYFDDLFPFNIIYLDDLSDKDNDNDKIDIAHSSGDLSIEPLPNVIKIDTHGYQYGVSWGMDTAYRLPEQF